MAMAQPFNNVTEARLIKQWMPRLDRKANYRLEKKGYGEMKGFIETTLSGRAWLVNVNKTVSVTKNSDSEKAVIYTEEAVNNCYTCDESYDEIKQKIEEAQHD
jgi:hypothetical protein